MKDEQKKKTIKKMRSERYFWAVASPISIFILFLIPEVVYSSGVKTDSSIVWLSYILTAIIIFNVIAFIRLFVLNDRLYFVEEDAIISKLLEDRFIQPPKERRRGYFLWNIPLAIIGTAILCRPFFSYGSSQSLDTRLFIVFLCAIIPFTLAWVTTNTFEVFKLFDTKNLEEHLFNERVKSKNDKQSSLHNEQSVDLDDARMTDSDDEQKVDLDEDENENKNVSNENEYDEQQERLYEKGLQKIEAETNNPDTILTNYQFTKMYLRGIINNSSSPENISKAKELLEKWEESYNELTEG